jgi:hypothetical protein
MSDFPGGQWSALLVGHQWPNYGSLATVSTAALNRGAIGEQFDNYANILRTVREGALAEQQGVTAEDTKQAFESGELSAHDISEVNTTKKSSYESARNATDGLRSDLRSIAEQGNADIDAIVASKDPAAIKISKISDVVANAQGQANIKAASHSQHVLDAVQQVVRMSGIDSSARQFAEQYGVDLDKAFRSPTRNDVLEQVRTMLNKTAPVPDSPSSISSGGPGSLQHTGTATGNSSNLLKGEGPPASTGSPPPSPGASQPGVAAPSTSNGTVKAVGTAKGELPLRESPTPPTSPYTPAQPNTGATGRGGELPMTAPPATSNTPALRSPVVAAGASTPGGPAVSTPNTPNISPMQSPSLSSPTNALSPESFAKSFNAGAQVGNPMSAGTEGLSTSAAHAMQPQAPFHPETMAAPPMAPTTPAASTPIFDHAYAAPTFDTTHPPATPPADIAQTVVAAPAAQAPPVMPMTAAPATPAGPLPAYGADLRPAAATAPAGPAPAPSVAAPASAPVHTSNAGQLGQPAVVRQQPTATATPAQPPTDVTENAVAATTTGAVAGASTVQAQAHRRLQRLLDAVARQEPKLRWAIGDREDGNTILTTDLSSGWIPPHVQIPTGIKLLTPERRSRTLEALLGETALTAGYSPGQYLQPTEDADPLPMSIRARDTREVEELGWELSQATKWRDGLPRLAHTLAKAASTGTGYLDSEVDLLREHLTTVAQQVLTDYPDRVDTAKVGNWQLLATIDALIKNEKTAANYHFAWFQASTLALKGGVQR